MDSSMNIKKIAAIALTVVLVLVMTAGLASLSSYPEPLAAGAVKTNVEVIKGKGYVKGKAEDGEQAGNAVIKDPDVPKYSNIDLLKRTDAFTTQQIDALQYGFYRFAGQKQLDIRDLFIKTDTAKEVTSAEASMNGLYTTEFTFTFGERSYQAEVDRGFLSIVNLRVYDPKSNNRQIFSSGDINGSKL